MRTLLWLLSTMAFVVWPEGAAQAQAQVRIAGTPAAPPLAAETGAPAWKASFSGHARTMQESYRGLDFGLGDVQDDAWLHQRLQMLLAMDHGGILRFATELTWGRMWGKDSPLSPPDQDEGDFLQLYGQVKLPLTGEDTLEIRAGRQTLYYGSGRLLASREGANQRLSHDALRFSWSRGEDIRVDAFVASPVQVGAAAFDNASHPDEVRFWSLYATLPSPFGHGHFLDLYYIGLHDEDSLFVESPGLESRHTFGTRWWSEAGPLLYNTELILQFGEAGERDILAGAASLGVGYAVAGYPWKPVFMLRADVISGGDDHGPLHTFHPLFQANNYFNEGGFVSPSNLYNLNPVLILQPHPKVEVTTGVNFLWRFSAQDAVYGPPLQRLAGLAPNGASFLGTAFNAAVAWKLTAATELFLGFTHHEAGPSLTGVGGRDENYFQASFRVEF